MIQHTIRKATPLLWPVFVFHELCHYLPAKILDVDIGELDLGFHFRQIDTDPNMPYWQNVVIVLFPSLIGILVWLLWTMMALYRGAYLSAFDAFLVNVAWQLTCLGDFYIFSDVQK